MKTISVTAHFDGEHIRLELPCAGLELAVEDLYAGL